MERKVSLMNHRKLNDYLIFLICGALLLCALLAGITWFIALYLAVTAESRPLRRK